MRPTASGKTNRPSATNWALNRNVSSCPIRRIRPVCVSLMKPSLLPLQRNNKPLLKASMPSSPTKPAFASAFQRPIVCQCSLPIKTSASLPPFMRVGAAHKRASLPMLWKPCVGRLISVQPTFVPSSDRLFPCRHLKWGRKSTMLSRPPANSPCRR